MSADAPLLVYGLMGAGLIAYVLTAGADFGGGVWDLLARGPRAEAQRAAVTQAIAPIWEANHVWLIFVIVVMFTAFPRAYAAIAVALHIPIVIALFGVVIRGAAFTFNVYGLVAPGERQAGGPLWRAAFGWSSLLTPLPLGMTLAALCSGEITLDGAGHVTSGFLAGWLSPFAWLTGLFTLALFVLLAAAYLAAEAEDAALRQDFRRRALIMEAVTGVLALLVFLRSSVDAPTLHDALARSPWTWPIQAATAVAASVAIGLLVTGRLTAARWAVAAQVAGVVIGWGLAMDRHLILPAMPLADGGARPEVMAALLPTLAIGGLLLAPSLAYLIKVFKQRRTPGAGVH